MVHEQVNVGEGQGAGGSVDSGYDLHDLIDLGDSTDDEMVIGLQPPAPKPVDGIGGSRSVEVRGGGEVVVEETDEEGEEDEIIEDQGPPHVPAAAESADEADEEDVDHTDADEEAHSETQVVAIADSPPATIAPTIAPTTTAIAQQKQSINEGSLLECPTKTTAKCSARGRGRGRAARGGSSTRGGRDGATTTVDSTCPTISDTNAIPATTIASPCTPATFDNYKNSTGEMPTPGAASPSPRGRGRPRGRGGSPAGAGGRSTRGKGKSPANAAATPPPAAALPATPPTRCPSSASSAASGSQYTPPPTSPTTPSNSTSISSNGSQRRVTLGDLLSAKTPPQSPTPAAPAAPNKTATVKARKRKAPETGAAGDAHAGEACATEEGEGTPVKKKRVNKRVAKPSASRDVAAKSSDAAPATAHPVHVAAQPEQNREQEENASPAAAAAVTQALAQPLPATPSKRKPKANVKPKVSSSITTS